MKSNVICRLPTPKECVRKTITNIEFWKKAVQEEQKKPIPATKRLRNLGELLWARIIVNIIIVK